MPVIIDSKTVYEGTATPTDLGTPVNIVSIPTETEEYVMEGYIDLSAMDEGDEVVIEEYIAVDGTNRRLLSKVTLSGKQEEPVLRFHSKIIKRNGYYLVTLTQTKGTIRSFPYFFVKLTFGVF